MTAGADQASAAERTEPPGRPEGNDFIRPFIMTGGRTNTADRRLRVETVVEAIPHSSTMPLDAEHRQILALCASPMSIADLGGRLQLPLGVVRILVGDLAANGQLRVHHTDPVEIELSTLTRMIERVRSI